MEKTKEWTIENSEYDSWVCDVADRFITLCDMKGYDLEKMEIEAKAVKKHTNPGIDDGIVMFAMETMDKEDFDFTFNAYHTVQIKYMGNKKTLDNVNTLTVVDSSFKEFFDQYYFNKTKTYLPSVNYAAHKVLNYFTEWYNLYIGDLYV